MSEGTDRMGRGSMSDEHSKMETKMNETFVMADGTPGYLEYVGTPIGRVFEFGPTVRCCRWEVRQMRAEFQLHDVQFRRNIDSREWHEIGRQVWASYQSKSHAITAVKMIEQSYRDAVIEDQLEQLDRQRIEAGLSVDDRDP